MSEDINVNVNLQMGGQRVSYERVISIVSQLNSVTMQLFQLTGGDSVPAALQKLSQAAAQLTSLTSYLATLPALLSSGPAGAVAAALGGLAQLVTGIQTVQQGAAGARPAWEMIY